MTTHEDFSPASQRPGTIKQPVVLITQLMHAAKSMHHIDNMFHWITNALLQQSGVGIVQIIATEADATNNYRTVLRASASYILTRPQQIQLYQQFRQSVDRIFYEKRAIVALPVLSIATPLTTNFLAQQNIHYWISYFMEKNILLPGTDTDRAGNTVPTPLRIVVSLFCEQPASQSSTRTTRFILEQAIRIAISQELLLATKAQELQRNTPANVTTVMTKLTLPNLIPIRMQNEHMDQTTNPFASVMIISDKKARQLYTLIDGKKDMTQLSQELQLSPKEIVGTLQILLQQKSITIQDLDGNVVEDTLLIKFLQRTNDQF